MIEARPLTPPPGEAPASASLRRGLRLAALVLAWVVSGLASAWCVAAFFFDVPVPWLRLPLAVIVGLMLPGAWFLLRQRPWLSIVTTLGVFSLVLAWWLTLAPSNDRDWQRDLAVLPWAQIDGNRIIVHNIRNCDYRTEADFDARHCDKTFDLGQLRTVDLFLVHWGSPLIAHTMVSFGFASGDEVCFSIEVRKEKGEGYSAARGFFRQYELTCLMFAELQEKCHINDRGRAAGQTPGFSRQIRAGLPGIQP